MPINFFYKKISKSVVKNTSSIHESNRFFIMMPFMNQPDLGKN